MNEGNNMEVNGEGRGGTEEKEGQKEEMERNATKRKNKEDTREEEGGWRKDDGGKEVSKVEVGGGRRGKRRVSGVHLYPMEVEEEGMSTLKEVDGMESGWKGVEATLI